MRVRVNSFYRYNPNGWDKFRPCKGNDLKLGQIVRVINLPSAPRANTMGQCYVATLAGKFLCMVSTSSLETLTPTQRDCFNRLRMARKDDSPIFVSKNEASIDLIVNGIV